MNSTAVDDDALNPKKMWAVLKRLRAKSASRVDSALAHTIDYFDT
jgi:hypothetical protein